MLMLLSTNLLTLVSCCQLPDATNTTSQRKYLVRSGARRAASAADLARHALHSRLGARASIHPARRHTLHRRLPTQSGKLHLFCYRYLWLPPAVAGSHCHTEALVMVSQCCSLSAVAYHVPWLYSSLLAAARLPLHPLARPPAAALLAFVYALPFYLQAPGQGWLTFLTVDEPLTVRASQLRTPRSPRTCARLPATAVGGANPCPHAWLPHRTTAHAHPSPPPPLSCRPGLARCGATLRTAPPLSCP